MQNPMANSLSEDLLHYNPRYRILICTQCRYAIQPTAVSRHLKELHHIYRGDRKRLLDSTTNMELADPADVQMPPADSSPVESLPVDDGVACNVTGCGHLCVTIKRMKRHWVTDHGVAGVEPGSWRPVKLQTFFRGAQLRYFIVNHPASTSTLQTNDYTTKERELPSEPSGIRPLPTIPRPTASNREELDGHLLLDHYTNVTYKTLVQREEGPKFWRTEILQIAQDHPFVMHGLLAISALHLARLHPDRRGESKAVAYEQQQHALPLYKAAMDRADEGTCHALFAFASILAVLEFAAPEVPDGLMFLVSKDDGELPAWLHLVRGGCILLWTLWHVISNGPMKALIGPGQDPTDVPYGPDDHHLTGLLPLFSSPGTVLSADSAELEVYLDSLQSLRWVFTLPYVNESSFTYRYVIQLWPAKVPQNYITMLNERRPGALILLAYYCVLLDRASGWWYLEGRAMQLMSHISTNLNTEHLIWIQWPLQVITISKEMEGGSAIDDPE